MSLSGRPRIVITLVGNVDSTYGQGWEGGLCRCCHTTCDAKLNRIDARNVWDLNRRSMEDDRAFLPMESKVESIRPSEDHVPDRASPGQVSQVEG
jgi:hypothetical protein